MALEWEEARRTGAKKNLKRGKNLKLLNFNRFFFTTLSIKIQNMLDWGLKSTPASIWADTLGFYQYKFITDSSRRNQVVR